MVLAIEKGSNTTRILGFGLEAFTASYASMVKEIGGVEHLEVVRSK